MKRIMCLLVLALCLSLPCGAFAAPLEGKVQVWEGNATTSAEGISVFVGQGIGLRIGRHVDTLTNSKAIVARTTTSRSMFYVDVPPGTYTVITWKSGYEPGYRNISTGQKGAVIEMYLYSRQLVKSGFHDELVFE